MRVILNVEDVITRIESNRIKHQGEYKETLKGYRSKLDDIIAFIDTYGDIQEIRKLLQKAYYLEVPQSFLSYYDRTIQMLKEHKGEEIEIDETDYRRYMLDDWEWKDTFNRVQAAYSSP